MKKNSKYIFQLVRYLFSRVLTVLLQLIVAVPYYLLLWSGPTTEQRIGALNKYYASHPEEDSKLSFVERLWLRRRKREIPIKRSLLKPWKNLIKNIKANKNKKK